MLASMRMSLADYGFLKPGGSTTKMLENLSAVPAQYNRVINAITTVAQNLTALRGQVADLNLEVDEAKTLSQ